MGLSTAGNLEYIQSAIDFAPDAVLIFDCNGKIIPANKILLESLGYTLKELSALTVMNLGTKISDLIPLQEGLSNLNNQESLTIYGDFLRKDSSTFPVEVKISTINQNNNSLYSAYVRDITGRREAQSPLRSTNNNFESIADKLTQINKDLQHSKSELTNANELLHSILKRVNDGFVAFDMDFNYTYINEAGARYLGYKPKDLIGQNYWKKFPEAIGTVFANSYLRALELQEAIHLEEYYEHWDKWFTNKIYPSKEGLTIFFSDITAAKNIEIELKRNNINLKKAQKLWHMGFLDWDLTTNEIELSDEVYKIYGLSKKEKFVTPELVSKIVHPDDLTLVQENLEWAVQGKKPYNIDHRIIRPSGEIRWVNAQAEQFFNNKKQPIQLLGTILDITERKERETELIIAKERAMESDLLKTEFIHNLSHEIRTPMNGIVGFSDLIGDDNLSAGERYEYSKIIKNCSQHLLNIIDDLLEISTLETKQKRVCKEIFYLNGLLTDLSSYYQLKTEEKGIPLIVKKELPDNMSAIRTDKQILTKILNILIDNAFKYTVSGQIEYGYHLQNNWVQLYVRDTGIGISPENHKIIFERFSQEFKEISQKTGGLGLGLPIAKENAALIGGTISVDSYINGGATFYVTIPYEGNIAVNR